MHSGFRTKAALFIIAGLILLPIFSGFLFNPLALDSLSSIQRLGPSLSSLFSLLIGFAAGLLFYFLRRSSLKDLACSAQKIHEALFAKRGPEGRKDELALLAKIIEEMAQEISSARAEIQKKSRQLHENRERIRAYSLQLEARAKELQQAQDHLIKSEKFASIGQLAASIAHEINNPLAGIVTYIKLLRRKLDGGKEFLSNLDTYREYLSAVEKETIRCGEIVKNLLDFARGSEPILKKVDINAVISETLFLIQYKLSSQAIRVKKRFGQVPYVIADFGQLKQVYLNILLNAIEAMRDGSRELVITTSYDKARKQVKTRISDTGEGIPPENLYKIYEPFFTTKEKGTGMGLPVVYGIIDRHRGEIHIESELGKGTTVTIELPSAVESR